MNLWIWSHFIQHYCRQKELKQPQKYSSMRKKGKNQKENNTSWSLYTMSTGFTLCHWCHGARLCAGAVTFSWPSPHTCLYHAFLFSTLLLKSEKNNVLFNLNFQGFFFFYFGFTALSRIFHLYRADHSSKVCKKWRTRRKNNLTICKQNLAFPYVTPARLEP